MIAVSSNRPAATGGLYSTHHCGTLLSQVELVHHTTTVALACHIAPGL